MKLASQTGNHDEISGSLGKRIFLFPKGKIGVGIKF